MKKVFLLLSIIFLFNGCEENQPPVISELNYSPQAGPGGTEFSIRVQALDDDGDAIIYLWIADEGEFVDGNFTSEVKWKSPEVDTDKSYPIIVMVSDGKERISDTLHISVIGVKKPTVETLEYQNLTETSVEIKGNVSSEGSTSVTSRGVCWSTSENPTISDSKTEDGSGSGSFTSQLAGLSANTNYFVRAYATNNAGTAYGQQISFTTTGLEPASLSVSPNTRSVSSLAGSTTYDVSNLGDGTMQWSATVTSGSNWAQITSGSSGENNGTVSIDYGENLNNDDRTAIITVIANGATGSPKNVTLVQDGKGSLLAVSPETQNVSSVAGSTTFDVSNNGGGTMNWSASIAGGISWARITSGGTGTNGGTISVEYDENSNNNQRTANITVSADGAGGSPKTVTIVQSGQGPVLVVSPETQNATYLGGSTIFDVSNGGGGSMNWSASIAGGISWARITSENTGTNSGTISVEYDENANNNQRTASIIITANGAGGSPKTVTIVQSGQGPTLVVSPETQNATYLAGSTTFDVSNNGGGTMNWSASIAGGISWARITSGGTGTNSGTINVEYDENANNNQRTANITVSATGAGGSPKTVTIVQSGQGPALLVSPETQNATYLAGSTTFDISNGGGGTMNWNASVAGGVSWARITTGGTGTNSGTINVEYDENSSSNQRTANITVSASGAGGSPKTVTIVQSGQGPALVVGPENQNVTSLAGRTAFDVSNGGGGTLNWNASVAGGVSWARITSGGTGTNSGTINVEYDENSNNNQRTANITVSANGAGGSPKTVTIVQTGQESTLVVSPESQNVTHLEGSTSFDVSNSGGGTMNWNASIEGGINWARITSGGTGTNSGTVNVDFDQNTSGSERTAEITVTASGANESPQTVTIVQAPQEAKLHVDPNSRIVGSISGTTTFEVYNQGQGTMAWNAEVTSGSDWAHITSTPSGSNYGEISVEYEANGTTIDRVAEITITAEGAEGSPETVTITQDGLVAVLEVTPLNKNVSANSGSAQFSVSNSGDGNMEWNSEVTSGQNWARITSGNSDTNSGTITVGYDENPDNTDRTAEITVTAEGADGSPKTITIVQEANNHILVVSPDKQTVGHQSGSTSFEVSNGGGGIMSWNANVSDGGSWATISSGPSGNNNGTIVVSYSANSGASERTATITVSASGATGSPKTVTIEQGPDSAVLLVTPETQSVGNQPGSTTFAVSNTGAGSMSWSAEVTSGSNWARIASGGTGSNSGTVTVGFDANPNESPRTANITVTASGAIGSPKTVTVQQDAGASIQVFTDSRDGNRYKYKVIGTQTWMLENLAYLPSVNDPRVSGGSGVSETDPRYYVYGNYSDAVADAKGNSNYSQFGVLYNNPAAQAACPGGWHLPSDTELSILTNFLINNGYGYEGSGNDIAKSMAANSLWDNSSSSGDPGNDVGSNNSSGFSARPGGYMYFGNPETAFYYGNQWAIFWSSTASNPYYHNRIIYHDRPIVSATSHNPGDGMSVRCVKD